MTKGQRWFFEQFSQSTIISGLLAVVIWLAIIYLAVTGGEIPEILYAGGMAVMAFFFGAKRGAVEGQIRARQNFYSSGGKGDGRGH